MYRRDYFLNETQRLAQMIAKLLGLKNKAEGHEELQQVYNNAMIDEFNITDEELQKLNSDEFKQWLAAQDFSPVKLDSLAQLLHLRAEPFERNPQTLLLLQKVIVLYDKLELEHHQQSFENIGKRASIQQFIQQYGA
ncbi:hypothetical protein [Mucilaginibacter terrae]|uniref:Holliday junction resolvasome RuvABC ATP-dependent DNA helicase subunit n=1 Tax=Mucilaginibacter terrae TaxID=1955052 RepID=A0ABU3GWL3_9SPHI|nr:hypothetical protein [Mucilaginibacter terrae]MDT3404157.1 Holliday junction resolvasome RuvABC ATP-dependent DNA helicase subunit [Mucilaginibacter terrae]